MKIFDPKLTGSIEFQNPVQGNIEITGDLVVPGSITAREFKTEFVSASIIYQSGSTKFGDTVDDTHIFSGSTEFYGTEFTVKDNIYNENLLYATYMGATIGTNTRNIPLTVWGNSTLNGNVFAGGSSTSNLQNWGRQIASINTGTNGAALTLKDSNGEWQLATYQNKLWVSQGADTRILVDENGKVGIGTTAPENALDIYSTAPVIQLRDSNSAGAEQIGYISFQDSGSVEQAWIGYGSSLNADFGFSNSLGDIKFITGGSERVRIVNSSSPELHIKAQAGTYGSTADINLWGTNNNAYGGSVIARSNISSITDGTAYGSVLRFYTTDTSNNLTKRVSIDSSGYTGIGTGTPASRLHTYASNDRAAIRIENGAANKVWEILPAVDGVSNTGISIFNVTDSTTPLHITDGGNVGIGTTSPGMYGSGMEIKTGTQSGLRLSSTSAGGGAIEIGADTSSGYIQNVIVGDSTHFYTSAATSGDTQAMTLTSDGRLGIANTAPQFYSGYKMLHIGNGSTGGTGIIKFGTGASADGPEIYAGVGAGANKLLFNTNGSTNAMVLLGSSVGIGTDSPAKKLEINAGASSDIVKIGNTSGGFVFGNTSNLASWDLVSGSNLRIRQGATTPFYIKSDGNIGIGNTSPDYKLDIENLSGEVWTRVNSATSSDNGYRFARNGVNKWVIYNQGSTDNFSIYHNTALTERFRIASDGTITNFNNTYVNGNLAIGDEARFDIGTLYVRDEVADGIIMRLRNTYNGGESAIRFQAENVTATNYYADIAFEPNAQALVFRTPYTSERMRITQDGNVGIGTTAPAYPLHIYDTDDSPLLVEGANTWSGIKYKDSGGEDWMWFNGNAGTFTFGGGGSSAVSNKKMHIHGATTIGSGIQNSTLPDESLYVQGSVRTKTVEYSWYQVPTISSSDSYVHIKTSLWMGGSPSGNIQHIMGGFTFKGYQYAPNGYGEGSVMFHNWNGNFNNLSVTNRGDWSTFVRSPYASTDGYCVLVIEHDNYNRALIDLYQFFTPYGWRTITVSAFATSNNLSGVY